MSQGLMRKPQPFTVGTRLSIPKCPDLSTSGHCVAPMDSLPMPQNLHHRTLHCPPPPQGTAHRRSPRFSLPDGEECNRGPHKSLARSIRKIALSRHGDPAHKEGAMRMSPRPPFINSHGNFNNNNSRGLRQLAPDAISPPCDWISNKSPASQAKCGAVMEDFVQEANTQSCTVIGCRVDVTAECPRQRPIHQTHVTTQHPAALKVELQNLFFGFRWCEKSPGQE
ncbi:PREDICTED: uncharacterized protein LOC108802348, partial [Nanorana parkeri]|uniref:uncharacterized protein LOC108802348 n=1 Tax=Nanorana parkeri TaxID=125878 RepID=UPI000854CBC7